MSLLSKDSNASSYREIGMQIMRDGSATVYAAMPSQDVIEMIHRHNPHLKVMATDCIMEGKKCYKLKKIK